jgi:integrase
LVLKGLAFGTIDSYLHGVQTSFKDESKGVIDVRSFYMVRQVLTGIRQRIGHLPKPKFAILIEFMFAFKRKMGDSIVDKRDWALFLFCWWGLLRKSELAALEWPDITAAHQAIQLWIKDSKTDKDRKGMWALLVRRGDELYPVKVFTAYTATVLQELCIAGRKFALASKNGQWTARRMAAASFIGHIKHWVAEIGLDAANYSGHSFRRGGTTAMYCAGVPENLIQIQGRWKSDAYKLYLQLGVDVIRRASSFSV